MEAAAAVPQEVRKTIRFDFLPSNFEERTVEKADGSPGKRMYISGVSSGSGMDGHNERMTPDCIKSFMKQANSGDILLYPDIHGIKASEDFGILTKAEVLANGDWLTEYRLYDDQDDVDQASRDRARKVWMQMNGLPPYKKPRQKGFSIEGFIPDNAILSAKKDEMGNLTNRVINDVELDGVVLVPRPAYKPSVAQAVYKSLGEMPPDRREKVTKGIRDTLQAKIEDREQQNEFYKKRWDLQDALESQIEKIMHKNQPDKQEQLKILFAEYSELMIELILSSEALFTEGEETEAGQAEPYSGSGQASKLEVLKAMLTEFKKLKKVMEAT